MLKVPNDIRRQIASIALEMPVVCEHTQEKHYVDGSILIAQGHTELEDGTKVIAGIQYEQMMPVVIAINHKRRMIQAYITGGELKLLHYIDTVINLAQEHLN